MPVPCKHCTSREHTSFYCRLKPRKPIKTNKLPNKLGRAGKATNAAVAKWKRTQKPNHQGYYECYMCGAWVTYLEAEHVRSKARAPELRTDPNNLKPVCENCNKDKESKDAKVDKDGNHTFFS